MKQITKKYKNFLFNLKRKIIIDESLNGKLSLDELFNYYGTDKGSNVKNPYSENSSENHGHGFAKFYEKKFSDFKNETFNLLEIGTWEGASTAAFSNYFISSKIYGIDKNFKFKYRSNRVEFNNCDITNKKDLDKFENKFREKLFKVIIDDASHILSHMIFSLNYFFKYLEKGGYFVLEDFNAPNYFPSLNDSNNEEISIGELLENIKKKKKFKSKLISSYDQDFLFKNISKIEVFKGKTEISDIAFLKRKLE